MAKGNPLWPKLAKETIAENPQLLMGMTPWSTMVEARKFQRKEYCSRSVDYLKKKQNGICYDCAQKALPNRVRCLYHNMKAAENSAKLKEKKRNERNKKPGGGSVGRS
jgi:hypothetical protein